VSDAIESRDSHQTATMPRLIAFPQNGIAYTECLYAALRDLGVEVIDGHWSGRWLLDTMRAGDVIQIHWPSFLYYDPNSRLRTLANILRMRIVLGLARRRGARVVWTAHNLYPHDGGDSLWAHRAVRRYIARIAERVFVHGPNACKIVAHEFGIGAERIVDIPHGNWIEQYAAPPARDTARTRLGIPSSTFVYGFVGTCKPYKNLDLLLETFARIEGDAMLLVAGHFQSDSYRAAITELVRRHGQNRVRFEPRFLSEEEIPVYLSTVDALVIPYSEILTSGSAMLGLSFGRPVIAPDLGGLRDMVPAACGVLYAAGAPDGLFDAMQRVRSASFDEAAIIECARRARWQTAAQPLCDLLAATDCYAAR
jgi:beta-1,4-mannosyltransferase